MTFDMDNENNTETRLPEEESATAVKAKSLAKSAALMGIIILVSKLLGFFRDLLTAWAFSTTDAGVAYSVASKLPITLFDLILGGVVTSAFIPVYNSIVVKKSKKEAVGFAQSFLNVIVLITSTIAVIGVIAAPLLVRVMAPELSEEVSDMAAHLTRIMFPMIIFVGIAFTFVGFLQSEGEYNIPALISLVSNVIMVAYLLFFRDRFGITGLSIALLIGWSAQAAVQIPAAVKRGFRFSLRAPLATPEIRRAAKNTLPILISTWTTPICNLINTMIASGLEEGRAIAAIDYANKLYIIIVGLFSFVATNLLFPYFARAAASGNEEESSRLTKVSMKTLTFIVAPISSGVFVMADRFIALIYERNEFTASDTVITAMALRGFAVGMVFAALSEVLIKAFFAREKVLMPMISALISMTFNIVLIFSLSKVVDITGVALVASASMALNMTINLILALKHKIVSFGLRDIADIIKSVLSAVAMGVAIYFISKAAPQSKIVAFIVPVLAGVLIYAVLTLILQSDEIKMMLSSLKRKAGGHKAEDTGEHDDQGS